MPTRKIRCGHGDATDVLRWQTTKLCFVSLVYSSLCHYNDSVVAVHPILFLYHQSIAMDPFFYEISELTAIALAIVVLSHLLLLVVV